MTTDREIIITPGQDFHQYWRDILDYSDLFYFMVLRDVLVRYKQTVLGVAWCLVRPLLMMVIFTVVFGYIARIPSGGIPYPLFVMAGMLPWQFYSGALTESSNSVVANAHMISKVYFPRLLVPATAVIVCLVDFLITFVLLVAFMMWYRFCPDWRILLLPLFVLLAMTSALGAGLWFSALNVKYRDFRHIVPFVVQLGLYISPVGFGSAVIPEKWRMLYFLNPVVGVIEGFRWSLLRGQNPLYLQGFLVSLALNLVVLVTGICYFRKNESSFADVI